MLYDVFRHLIPHTPPDSPRLRLHIGPSSLLRSTSYTLLWRRPGSLTTTFEGEALVSNVMTYSLLWVWGNEDRNGTSRSYYLFKTPFSFWRITNWFGPHRHDREEDNKIYYQWTNDRIIVLGYMEWRGANRIEIALMAAYGQWRVQTKLDRNLYI